MRCLRKGRSLMTILISPMIPILSMTESGPIKEAEKSNKEHEQHDVAMKTETDVTSDPSTINLPDGSNNPNGSMATPSSNGAAKDMEAEHERLMQEISEDLKDSPVESQAIEKPSQEPSSASSAPAPKSNLVFENSKWDDSMLASSVLFIEEFCQEVKAKKFNEKLSDKKFKGLSKKCANLSSYMGSFIHRFKPTYGPGSVTERKEIPMNFYKDVLKAEDFDVYAKWLVKNIPEIYDSLKHMSMEYFYLTEEQL
ncbi:hypothetical protein X943_002114, partial [Babesia divergens]